MVDSVQALSDKLISHFGDRIQMAKVDLGEVTIVIAPEQLLDVCRTLRDHRDFHFEQMLDLCGVDYSEYGEEEWTGPRFAVVYHLLSLRNNQRLRVRTFAADNEHPRVPSVMDIWNAASWYEREAFDLFGILFDGHPDLRRILTDYGFIGHPFRKDFPLIGNVEMRYDPDRKRVVYEPVSIEMRVTVPRVIRHDSRYDGRQARSTEVDGG